MQFNSYIFIFVFLPLVVSGYFLINQYLNHKLSKVFLLIMSLWFYGYFQPIYLYIMLGSILFNYCVVCNVDRFSNYARKVIFIFGIIGNLGILFVFKYYDFFISNVNVIFKENFKLLELLLPLGISFFTFQQLSYVIDVYKKEAVVYPFVDYALYIAFFPQLVAGPIVLHDEFIPQINDPKNRYFNDANMQKGIMAFTLGLAKKVLLADMLGMFVNWCFTNVNILSSIDVIVAMLSYTLQIYFDFSGYSDMATGLAWMLNIELPMNFNSPYKAVDIVDFWKRWHMTLTRFFTKYVYIPLGGNRKGKRRTTINIMIVFLVSGLWHGANWTFIVWGILHGIANVFVRKTKVFWEKIPCVIKWVVNFCFLNVTWLIFRADSLHQVGEMLSRLSKLDFTSLSGGMVPASEIEYRIVSKLLTPLFPNIVNWVFVFGIIGIALFIALRLSNIQERIKNYCMTWGHVIMLSLLFIYTVLSLTGQSTFLYFNF